VDLKLENLNVVVTGGAGFIGSNLVAALLSRGCKVTVFDSFERGTPSNLPADDKNLTLKRADLRDYDGFEYELQGVDVLFDLAARVSGIRTLHDLPADMLDSNARSTLHVAEAASKAKVGRAIFASSSCVYDHPRVKVPHQEDDVRIPQTSYGQSKLFGESVYRACGEQYGLKYAIVRFFNIYGPNETLKGPHVIPDFIMKAFECEKGKKTFEILGDGKQTRSFLYVSDAVDGVMRLAEVERSGDIVNIGSDREISVQELARLVLKTVGVRDAGIEFVHSPVHPKDVRRRAADIRTARTLLGWQPKVTLEDGLRTTVDWFKGQPDK
jgi:nucleoside-diphosphate-sugar epimerase